MQRRTRIIIAVVAAVALIATSLWVAFRPGKEAAGPSPAGLGPGEPAEVALAPAKPDPAGLDPTGALTLTAVKPLSAAAVKESLTVQPAVALKVEKADQEGKVFTVQPAQTLESNRVYRFKLAPASGVNRPYQWSFQTRAEFRLLGTLPRHQGTGVPVNTGIEFTFTHEDYEDLTLFFSMTPTVTGRLERHKQTVSFVPDKELQPGTIYTVTLKQGIGRTAGEGQITQDVTFSFETQDPSQEQGNGDFYLPTDMVEFPANDRPVLGIWLKGSTAEPVSVSLFRYPDAAGFIAALQKAERIPWWASASRTRYKEAEAGLTQVATFTAPVQQYDNGSFLIFPDQLPPGYYLATLQVRSQLRQVRIQVTDLSYHLTATTTKTLVWLNDVATGKPAAGARVAAHGSKESATTGTDGVAVVPTPDWVGGQERAPLFLTAKAGEKEAVVYGPASYYYWDWDTGRTESKARLYWRYLYLDRSLYKPEDTVQVWGVIHPREPGAAKVDQVVAEVIRNDYRSFDGGITPLVSSTLAVTNSTFTGSLPLPKLNPGHYEVRVRVGEERFSQYWFEVATYAKPAYQLDVTADQRAVFSGQPATFRVKASFFEGTPVPAMKLNYRFGWNNVSNGSVTTDPNGEAVITYTPPHDNAASGSYPGHLYFHVTAGLPELGEIADERGIQLFQRDITLTTRVNQTASKATVEVQLNQVTLDQINAGTGYAYKGAAAPGRAVQFEITELNWKKIAEGRYYDFIEKVVQTRYRYEPDNKEIGTYPAVSDASGKASHHFDVAPDKHYQVMVRLEDSRGLSMADAVYVSGQSFRFPYSGDYYRWHSLEPEAPGKEQGDIGEPLGFVMEWDRAPVPNRTDGFLFLTARRGLQEYKVQNTSTHRVTLKETDPPNTTLKAVYFDGRQYYQTQRFVRFDPEARRLQVTVTPDKPAYRPGDEVKLQVQVQDRQGRPAAGAQVNLNLVDEALFALREQNVNTLGSLYGDYIEPGILRTRSSHDVPQMRGGAEKGGEGGGVRRDFKDAVFFTTVTTDPSGRAAASFKVPDNLTMWRLTYQAVRPQTMEAGNGTVGIAVKLPFFADIVLGETFLTGDQPVVQFRTYGTALTGSEDVRYKVEVEGPGGKLLSTEQSGRPFSPLSVPLKKLEAAGAYTVRVSAATGPHSDALEKSFKVVDTYVRQNRVDFALLESSTTLKGAEQGLTSLTFLDWERGRYLDALYRLSWYWGNRFEKKLARAVAADLLKEHFGAESGWAEPELDSSRYQTADGSIAILPYSDGDLKLSALAADLAPERFDQMALSLYFQKILEDKGTGRDRKILALYGLASLNQPVLNGARSLLTEADLSTTEQLYLALAIADLGDLESVRPLYRDLIQKQAEAVGRDLRLKAGRDTDEQLEATALAAALAGKLGEPETAPLLSFLTENRPGETLILLEQLLAVQAGLGRIVDQPVAFTYTLNGQETRKELKPGEHFRVALKPEELKSLRFKQVEGSVAVIATYEASGRPALEKGGASITRTFSPAPDQWKPGDIVSVTLAYGIPANAPKGGFELTEYLPSGLRLLERTWDYGVRVDWNKNQGWPLEVNGQRVIFWAPDAGKPIQYFARVVSPGEYQAEEPVLQHQKSGLIYGAGSKATVRIAW